jgi:ketosteroid isomerase-like protein
MDKSPRVVVEQWFAALGSLDLEAFVALHREDVVYNVAGRTEVSGRWQGRGQLLEVVLPRVIRNLDLSTVCLSRRYRIMAVDGDTVVGLMQGDAKTELGHEYNHICCLIFRVEDARIAEVWEFFDTFKGDSFFKF